MSSTLYRCSDNFCIKKGGMAKKAVSILRVNAEQIVQKDRSAQLLGDCGFLDRADGDCRYYVK